MASCKECLSVDVCETAKELDLKNAKRIFDFNCSNFKDRNRFVELPCKVGDTVYFIKAAFSLLPVPKAEKIQRIELYDIDVIFRTANRAFNDKAINDTVFLTKEEAEKALEEGENNEN